MPIELTVMTKRLYLYTDLVCLVLGTQDAVHWSRLSGEGRGAGDIHPHVLHAGPETD